MMREIKFRAWDNNGRFVFVQLNNIAPLVDFDRLIDIKELDIWQQYTGLKDKNDTEIYEGDIVKSDYMLGVVEFMDGMFCVSFWDEGDAVGEIDSFFKSEHTYEVIGNIYQDGKLLK